jgi:hypothetical protein
VRRSATFLTLAVLASPLPAVGQSGTVGNIDFYGIHTVSPARLREALRVKEGDSITSAVLKESERLESIPGVQRAAVDAVCCEEGKTTLYIGIEEAGTAPLVFNPAPGGQVLLPDEIVRSYEAFEAAFMEAVQAGDFVEDGSQGHALMHFPAARAAQERFVHLASHRRSVLTNVLHQSANEEHRAIAAQVLAYSPAKRTIVPELVLAIRDPSSKVRNNAVRALALIAGYARQNPDRGIVVPPEPLVDLLNSLAWTDRNKSSMALMQITETRDSALLALLKDRALPSLIEMARWKAPGHAVAAFFILGRIAALPDNELFAAWENDRREEIIEAARQ